MPEFFLRIARCLLVVAGLAASAAAHAAASEDDFLAAREAFRAADARKLEVHARRLGNHVLEPYVAYWRLRLRLEEASAAEVRRFFTTYADTRVANLLLGEWLRLLGRTQRWADFDADFPRYTGEELDITCYGIQAKARSGRPEAMHEARPLWFVAREMPESCTTLFSALVSEQRLSTEDVWTRVRIGLEAGQLALARRAAEHLPAGERPDHSLLTSISTNAGGYLEKQKPELRTRAERETVMFAAYRLARTSPQQAAAHWSRVEGRFAPEERAYVWGQIAYFGSLRHDPDTLAWFDKARDLSDVQLAWKARAALRLLNWREVLAAIDAMTEREREQSVWRYWKARAFKAGGRTEEALALFKPLAREFSFYGQLSLEELGEKISTPPAVKPTPAELKAIAENAGLRRALEFYRLNLRVDGVREWVWTIRSFDDRQLLAAAELARRSELYDRAINTADRTENLHDFTLRYLAPFRDILKTRSSQMNLDEAWVYGLIRQESRFIADARSRVGASGLMQLMPATAKWVAGKMGLRDWRWTHVNEIDLNVSLGTYYLRHVLDFLDGNPVLASAAYNAGPGRARAWRTDGSLEGAIYAETIPFGETRDYVKKVMSNASYYAHTFSEQLQSLRQRLGVIGPRLRGREPGLGDTP